jgi:2-polyprenyl-3-methyl-5-hydroxy-6-metoxy-1,4-benzoquinol methylase
MYSASYYEERKQYYFKNPITNRALTKENDNIRDFKNGLALIDKYKTGGRLLDVGCALGIFLVMAHESGWETYGVDVSPYATNFARNVMGQKVRTGTLEQIKYPDNWFDVVTVWDALEHFDDPSKQLQEIRRILKDDGIVFMNTPNEEAFMRVLAWKMYCVTRGKFQYPVRKLYHRFHLYYFTAKTLRSLLEENGFHIAELRQKRIPIVKARGNLIEKMLVQACSLVDRAFGREYELLAIARKKQ